MVEMIPAKVALYALLFVLLLLLGYIGILLGKYERKVGWELLGSALVLTGVIVGILLFRELGWPTFLLRN